jgi:cell division protease FtsH
LAKALLEWETIDAEQIEDIMTGKQPRPPKDWVPNERTRNSGSGSAGGSGPVSTDSAPATVA